LSASLLADLETGSAAAAQLRKMASVLEGLRPTHDADQPFRELERGTLDPDDEQVRLETRMFEVFYATGGALISDAGAIRRLRFIAEARFFYSMESDRRVTRLLATNDRTQIVNQLELRSNYAACCELVRWTGAVEYTETDPREDGGLVVAHQFEIDVFEERSF
jgi:hypothetical protein